MKGVADGESRGRVAATKMTMKLFGPRGTQGSPVSVSLVTGVSVLADANLRVVHLNSSRSRWRRMERATRAHPVEHGRDNGGSDMRSLCGPVVSGGQETSNGQFTADE